MSNMIATLCHHLQEFSCIKTEKKKAVRIVNIRATSFADDSSVVCSELRLVVCGVTYGAVQSFTESKQGDSKPFI